MQCICGQYVEVIAIHDQVLYGTRNRQIFQNATAYHVYCHNLPRSGANVGHIPSHRHRLCGPSGIDLVQDSGGRRVGEINYGQSSRSISYGNAIGRTPNSLCRTWRVHLRNNRGVH